MNWQNCNNIIFCGISDSYEKYYQAIRRCYRFGQTKEVNVYIVISTRELPVYNNILEKGRLADEMNKKMFEISKVLCIHNGISDRCQAAAFVRSTDSFHLPD